jgi:hypothetical protein
MNPQIPASQKIKAKISVYSRIGNLDSLLSSSVCSVVSENSSAGSIKNVLRAKLNIEKTDPRFVKEILYYKGNTVDDSFEIKSNFFTSLVYELYLTPSIGIV